VQGARRTFQSTKRRSRPAALVAVSRRSRCWCRTARRGGRRARASLVVFFFFFFFFFFLFYAARWMRSRSSRATMSFGSSPLRRPAQNAQRPTFMPRTLLRQLLEDLLHQRGTEMPSAAVRNSGSTRCVQHLVGVMLDVRGGEVGRGLRERAHAAGAPPSAWAASNGRGGGAPAHEALDLLRASRCADASHHQATA